MIIAGHREERRYWGPLVLFDRCALHADALIDISALAELGMSGRRYDVLVRLDHGARRRSSLGRLAIVSRCDMWLFKCDVSLMFFLLFPVKVQHSATCSMEKIGEELKN